MLGTNIKLVTRTEVCTNNSKFKSKSADTFRVKKHANELRRPMNCAFNFATLYRGLPLNSCRYKPTTRVSERFLTECRYIYIHRRGGCFEYCGEKWRAHTHTRTHARTPTHTPRPTRPHTHTHTYTHQTHPHKHPPTHTYTQPHRHTHTHTHTSTHTPTHTHKHHTQHTHTPTQTPHTTHTHTHTHHTHTHCDSHSSKKISTCGAKN